MKCLRSYALTVCISLLLLGCSSESKPPLRVGVNLWPGYEFLFLAQEKGFFARRGLDVRLVEFNSLSDARRAYERGQLEALATTIIEVLQIRDQSRRSPAIVRVIDYSNGADVIVARPGVRSIGELKGGRVGVELASLGVYILARGLELNGLAIRDISTVSLDQLSMEEAFRAGKIDAAVSYPPISNKLLAISGATTVFSTAQISGEVVDVIAADEEVIKRNPGQVEALLDGFEEALQYLSQHPDEGYGIMARREGLSSAEFKATLTDEIVMLSDKDQRGYLEPAGRLEALLHTSARVLEETRQISSSQAAPGTINRTFLK